MLLKHSMLCEALTRLVELSESRSDDPEISGCVVGFVWAGGVGCGGGFTADGCVVMALLFGLVVWGVVVASRLTGVW